MIVRRGVALWAYSWFAILTNAAPPAVFKDSTGNVYVHTGVTAGSRVNVDLVGAPDS